VIIFYVADSRSINEKIIEKIKKFTNNKKEIDFCQHLLDKEILWSDLDDPPFRRDFPQSLNRFFTYGDSDQ